MREHIHLSFWAEADKMWECVEDYENVGSVLISILQKIREIKSYCDPLLVQTVQNLAQRYCDDEKFLDAECLFIELMETLQLQHPEGHPLVDESRRGLQHVQHLFLAKLADKNEDRVASISEYFPQSNKLLRSSARTAPGSRKTA